VKCQGTNAKGKPCGNDAIEGTAYCIHHSKKPRWATIWKWLSGGVTVLVGFYLWLLSQGFESIPTPTEIWCEYQEKIVSPIPAPNTHFTFLVATLDGDSTGKQTKHIVAALRGQKGIGVLRTCRVLHISTDGLETDAESVAMKYGQQWLKERNADLLIWGEVVSADKALRIWFLPRKGTSNFRKSPYLLTDAIILPQDFHQDLINRLVAIALSSLTPVTESAGDYLVETLKPVVIKLEHLLADLSTDVSNRQRASLYLGLGVASATIGSQTMGKTGREWLGKSTEALRTAVSLTDPNSAMILWAGTQGTLAETLVASAYGASETTHLDEALFIYRKILDKLSRKESPELWGIIMADQGDALLKLGILKGGAPQVDRAVDALQSALNEASLNKFDVWRVITQITLAQALQTLAMMRDGRNKQEEAVSILRKAQNEAIQINLPLVAAVANMGLSGSLLVRNIYNNDDKDLYEAIQYAKLGLSAIDKDKAPQFYGHLSRFLGRTLKITGQKANNPVLLNDAKKAYQSALEVLSPNENLLDWSDTQLDLAVLLSDLGNTIDGAAMAQSIISLLPMKKGTLEYSILLAKLAYQASLTSSIPMQVLLTLYKDALSMINRSKNPLGWAELQDELCRSAGDTTRIIIATTRTSEDDQTGKSFKEWLDPCYDALKERTRSKVPLYWAKTQIHLGAALKELARWEQDTEYLEQAVTAYKNGLKEITHERDPIGWAHANNSLGTALVSLGWKDRYIRRVIRFSHAVSTHRKALLVFERDRFPREWAGTQFLLGEALFASSQTETNNHSLNLSIIAYRLAMEAGITKKDRSESAIRLSVALIKLGHRTKNKKYLEDAVTTLRKMIFIKTKTDENSPLTDYWLQYNLGEALTSLGQMKQSPIEINQGMLALRIALNGFTKLNAQALIKTTKSAIRHTQTLLNEINNTQTVD
jgi:tetratricopeptide (TPR) repeat protein